MNINFPVVLVSATFLTGMVWAADAVFFARHRRDQTTGKPIKPEPMLVEIARSFFPVLLIVLLLRSFLVEPFRIPSGSMMPTLLIGDFILVNKFSYGIRLPVLDKKIIPIGEPKRGDIVVFRYPEDPSVDFIKRVVGLPGDRIGYHNKTLTINGTKVDAVQTNIYQGVGQGALMSGSDRLHERLGDVDHDILQIPGHLSMEGDWVVPPNQYFMMGDNRDNSRDSRYWGTLPEENIVGKAFFIWMNWDWSNGGVGWSRMGTTIH